MMPDLGIWVQHDADDVDEQDAMTKTHTCSCHGKIRFDSFQVDLLVGWLRIRPTQIWKVSSRNVTMPAARAANQIRSRAWRSEVAGAIWSVA